MDSEHRKESHYKRAFRRILDTKTVLESFAKFLLLNKISNLQILNGH